MRSIPPRLAFLDVINTVLMEVREYNLRSTALVIAHTRQLDLHAVHAVDAVNKQDKDEYERNLEACQMHVKPVDKYTVPSCHIVVLRLSGSRK
jgi:hypothetical protein